jgi:hypothetical protein
MLCFLYILSAGFKNLRETNIGHEWMALLLRMREVLGSNFSTETGIVDDVYCDLPQSLQQMSAWRLITKIPYSR